MIVSCPACQAKFRYDESRFGNAESKHFKCAKCDAPFSVANPKLLARTPPMPISFGAEPTQPPSQEFGDLVGDASAAGSAGQSIARMNFEHQAPQTKGPCLVFLNGPNASMAFELTKPETLIGRGDGDIATMDPDTSGKHAIVVLMSDGTVWLTDLGSKNGTFTNGAAIDCPTRLQDRQEFSCGNASFMLRIF